MSAPSPVHRVEQAISFNPARGDTQRLCALANSLGTTVTSVIRTIVHRALATPSIALAKEDLVEAARIPAADDDDDDGGAP